MKNRVMVKLSGEALSGEGKQGFDAEQINYIANEFRKLRENDFQVAVVLGAGNLFRGKQLGSLNIHRASADYLGMLATVMNSLVFAESLNNLNIKSTALSMIDMPRILTSYERIKALNLIKDNVLICGGGTGRPYFTTDTNAVQLALELDCDSFLKATKVEGLFTADPKKTINTKFIKKTTFEEAMQKGYKVMDIAAFALCSENKLTVRIFDMKTEGNLLKAAKGENIGSIIEN